MAKKKPLMKRSKAKIREDRDAILALLTEEGLSTREIAEELSMPQGRTFRDLRWLENQDLVESELKKGGPYYCVDCEEIVTPETHELCRGKTIRPVNPDYREWRLASSA